MKINEMLTLVNYAKGGNRPIKYIVIHYTANNGDSAKSNCKYFYNTYRGASAHYFVDEYSIWRCVRDQDIAWAVGTNKGYLNDCRNTNSINVELCSRRDKDGKYYFKEQTLKNAQELVYQLCKQYNLDVETSVIRHYDATRENLSETTSRG